MFTLVISKILNLAYKLALGNDHLFVQEAHRAGGILGIADQRLSVWEATLDMAKSSMMVVKGQDNNKGIFLPCTCIC